MSEQTSQPDAGMIPPELNTLQRYLIDQATQQAEQEWGSFEDLIHQWFSDHKAGRTRLTRNAPVAYHPGNAPGCWLSAFLMENSVALNAELLKLAIAWKRDRIKVLVDQATQDIIGKLQVLPGANHAQ